MPKNNKILIALDIDQMHLHDHTNKKPGWQSWIKSRDYWHKLYSQMTRDAEQQGYDVVFAIITSKPKIDPFVVEQVQSFRDLLQKHNEGNFTHKLGHDFVVMREWSKTQLGWQDSVEFKSLINGLNLRPKPHSIPTPNVETLFHQDRLGPNDVEVKKSAAVKRIAGAHDVPLENCFMMDDSPMVHKDMEENGINYFKAPQKFTAYKNCELDEEVVSQVLGEDDELDMTRELEKSSCELGQEIALKFYNGFIYQHHHSHKRALEPRDVSPSSNVINPESASAVSSSHHVIAPSQIGQQSQYDEEESDEEDIIQVQKQPRIGGHPLTIVGSGGLTVPESGADTNRLLASPKSDIGY